MPKKIDDLFAGYNGKYQLSEVDWGADVGNEIISDQEHLMSVPGMKEKLLEGKAEALEDCAPESEVLLDSDEGDDLAALEEVYREYEQDAKKEHLW